MSTLVGCLVVLVSVLGGFAMVGGHFGVLFQPSELVVICGASAGTLIIMAPGQVGKRVLHALKQGAFPKPLKQEDYLDLLRMLFDLFQVMRREGILSLEKHVEAPAESTIFKNYPRVRERHHLMNFLTEGLRQMVDGCSPQDLALLFEAELDTLHDEENQPIALLKSASDALPGLGIVAAVLGIIVTMGHMDGGPEVVGHHVAAALVGTFLGILLCYGFLGPIATSIELQVQADSRLLVCAKEGLLAASRGCGPGLAIEFARRALFSDERPTSADVMPKGAG